MARVTININPVEKILLKRNLGNNSKAQKFFTSEVRRLSDPYVPMDTGMLKNNVFVGTNKITYKSPYAAKNYYSNGGNGVQGTSQGGLRGKQWVKRMWSDKGRGIVQSVDNFVNGGR